jgi:hypothetical protein
VGLLAGEGVEGDQVRELTAATSRRFLRPGATGRGELAGTGATRQAELTGSMACTVVIDNPNRRRCGVRAQGSSCCRRGRTRGELPPPPLLGFLMLQLLYTGVATSSWHVVIIHFHDAIVCLLCCIRVLDMLRVSHDVSKLNLNIFDVANINFQCCKC